MDDEAKKDVAQLAAQVTAGFTALSGEYQALFEQQKQLEHKLSWAKQQYLDLLKRFTPSTLSQDHIAFLQELERAADEQPRARLNVVDVLAQGDDVERKSRAVVIRQAEVAAAALRAPTEDAGVRIWSGPQADPQTISSNTKTSSVTSPMEKDFTALGTPSKLGCPFASGAGRGSSLATPRSSASRVSSRGRRSKRPSFTDPIRAETCGNMPSSPSVSVEGSAAVCPIRFLDQHDPEEVAKYFEKHKHELPRSHEVCITRFQSNQESIDQLDRKYGNLVNMIQGLGQKHQAWLPEEPDEVVVEEPEHDGHDDTKYRANVTKWARAVSDSLQGVASPPEDIPPESAVDDSRTSHFDRPLKDVRVGESPSRPWGITIPAKYTNAESSSSVGSAATASPQLPLETDREVGQTPQKPAGKCPFDHEALARMKAAGAPPAVPTMPTMPTVATAPTHPGLSTYQAPSPRPEPTVKLEPTPPQPASPSKEQDSPRVIPQMVFNGPVFLGYPPDQLIALLQNSNLGAAFRGT
ncbi:hypothetical protein B5807_01217 [Epicoccum nigrum]|uniref:Uncharacterized protein n=1 Tax=Epicoccum nigrum TaxID=105696 RepID=A0A1Y2MBN4_EPING|nr:hypothetical protein B5807_01217 [Epicoccum nigrum]